MGSGIASSWTMPAMARSSLDEVVSLNKSKTDCTSLTARMAARQRLLREGLFAGALLLVLLQRATRDAESEQTAFLAASCHGQGV